MKRIIIATAVIISTMAASAGVASACPVKRSDKALAASEILRAWNRGTLIYEDYSFQGMSPRVDKWNDRFIDECRGQHWRACLIRISRGR